MENKKIKVITLGDMPLGTSGVGNQTRFVIEALLDSGKFEVFSLGGAITHPDTQNHRLQKNMVTIGKFYLLTNLAQRK